MTYTLEKTAIRTTKIEDVLAEVKPTAERLGAMARIYASLRDVLPLGRRQREDVGLGEGRYNARNETVSLMARNGIYF